MDIWLLLSMMFVASAIFEYAVLLAIRFGNNWKINEQKNAQKKKEQKCYKVDRISLKMFIGTYIFAAVTYFFVFINRE